MKWGGAAWSVERVAGADVLFSRTYVPLGQSVTGIDHCLRKDIPSIHPFSSVTTGSYTRVDPGPSSENEGIQGRYPHRIDDRGSRIDSTTTSTSTSTSTSTQDVQDHHPPHLVALAVGRFRPRSSYRTPFATLVARPDSHAHAHAHARFLRSVRSPTRTCLRRTRIGSSTSSCTPCTAIGMSS